MRRYGSSMSTSVGIDTIADVIGDYDAAYLISVGIDAAAKVVSVEVSAADGVLVVTSASAGSAANVAANAKVTVLCPPREPNGFSLIIDGTASRSGTGFVVAPTNAILHRPAAHADNLSDTATCENDCQHLTV